MTRPPPVLCLESPPPALPQADQKPSVRIPHLALTGDSGWSRNHHTWCFPALDSEPWKAAVWLVGRAPGLHTVGRVET